MVPRILVCDDIAEVGLDILRRAGFEVRSLQRKAPGELQAAIPDFDALLVRSRTRVTDELLELSPRLKVIGRVGFGLDTIDVESATRRGVLVVDSPEGNALTAAEFTVGLIFALARHIPQGDAALRSGRWERRRHRGVEISGKVLGVVGMGRVGRIVAERARAIRMRVLVYDPQVSEMTIRAVGAEPVSWGALLGESDFLTVHVSAGENTRHLIGDAEFGAMKDRIRIINTARGAIVNEDALMRALRSGKVAGAAVDAFEHEPPTDSPLLNMPQVIVTPHLVGTTFEAQINTATAVAEQVRDFLLDGVVRGAVNPQALAHLD